METLQVPSEAEIKDLVLEVFGLSVVRCRKFVGYDDLNFQIECESSSRNSFIPFPSPNEFVLKISNHRNTLHPEPIETQNIIMTYLSSRMKTVDLPLPRENVKGEFLSFVDFPWKTKLETEKRCCIVRLLSFIPGMTMIGVRSEPNMNVLFEVGKMVSELSNSLESFSKSNLQNVAFSSNRLWSLEGVCQEILNPLMKATEDEKRLSVFREVIDEFEAFLIHKKQFLKIGIIHGDVNEGNLVMQEHQDGSHSLKGLIDFSDMYITCSIFELIMALCYMMLECEEKGTLHPIDAGGHVLAGYLTQKSLSKSEMDILKLGIEARCTQSLIIGLYTYKYEQPGNDYVLITQRKGWQVLKMLRELSLEDLLSRWDNIVKNVTGKSLWDL